MTVLEHILLAIGICIGALALLLSEWAKLDPRAHRPWQRHLYLLRPLDTVEWFMLGRNELALMGDLKHHDQMTRFMHKILSKYEEG